VSVRDVIVAGDVEAFGELLAPDVVWVGVLPGQLCRNREQVLGMFRRARDNGRRWHPEILAEHEGKLVVDPRIEPPPELHPTLHQVVVLEDEHVVEIRDYPDRLTAVAALDRVRSLW
jgi:ketosteroid isomerase-like protein